MALDLQSQFIKNVVSDASLKATTVQLVKSDGKTVLDLSVRDVRERFTTLVGRAKHAAESDERALEALETYSHLIFTNHR